MIFHALKRFALLGLAANGLSSIPALALAQDAPLCDYKEFAAEGWVVRASEEYVYGKYTGKGGRLSIRTEHSAHGDEFKIHFDFDDEEFNQFKHNNNHDKMKVQILVDKRLLTAQPWLRHDVSALEMMIKGERVQGLLDRMRKDNKMTFQALDHAGKVIFKWRTDSRRYVGLYDRAYAFYTEQAKALAAGQCRKFTL